MRSRRIFQRTEIGTKTAQPRRREEARFSFGERLCLGKARRVLDAPSLVVPFVSGTGRAMLLVCQTGNCTEKSDEVCRRRGEDDDDEEAEEERREG